MYKGYGVMTQVRNTTYFDHQKDEWTFEIEMTQKHLDKVTKLWGAEYVASMGATGSDFDTVKHELKENFSIYIDDIFGDLRNDAENCYLKR